MSRQLSPLEYVGYQVRTADGGDVVGVVEAVQPQCLRLERVPGAGSARGYVPLDVVALADDSTKTLHLREGVGSGEIAGAPRPPDEHAARWHISEEWWADLMGHYGLYEPTGRGNEPLLHPDQS